MRALVVIVAVVFAALVLAGCEGPSYTNAYVTGYTWWDNNPPGSAEVCCPSVHQSAGGTGTYTDPITVAVDYSSGTTLQFASGTLFYIPNLRAYFVAEDRTGEQQADNTAANGSNPHLDVWADGSSSTAANADACVRSFTNTGLSVIVNPNSNYQVVVGPLAANGACRANYGNTPTTTPTSTSTTTSTTVG
jgi:hypothetical protein